MTNPSEEEIEALRKLLASAAPEIRSDKMWKAIQEGLDHPRLPETRPSFWQRFWQPWLSPRMAMVFGSLLVAGLVVVLTQGPKPVVPAPRILDEPADAGFTEVSPEIPQTVKKAVRNEPEPARIAPPSRKMESGSRESKSASGGRQDAFAEPMAASPAQPAPAAAATKPEAIESGGDLSTPMLSAEQAGLGASRAARPAYRSPAPSALSMAPAASPARLPQAEGEALANGAWDWQYLQFAFNNRLWPKVAAELVKARQEAGRPAEKAFAASALHLLSQPGQPMANYGLEGTESLGSEQVMVLSAGTWSLNTVNGMATFKGKVAVRQAGLRAEMSQLVLDLNQGRALYGDARFIRLAGEDAAVVDGSGKAVTDNEFSSPDGAVYQFGSRQLKIGRER